MGAFLMASDKLYLSYKDKIAVISYGSPQLGDKDITVLSVEKVNNMKEAKKWFKKMKIEQPWECRN